MKFDCYFFSRYAPCRGRHSRPTTLRDGECSLVGVSPGSLEKNVNISAPREPGMLLLLGDFTEPVQQRLTGAYPIPATHKRNVF